MKLLVGNVADTVSEDDLNEAFEAFGSVTSVEVGTHKKTGKSAGYAYVEMASDAEGKAAIDGLDGQDVGGATISVAAAESRAARRGGKQRGGFKPRGGFGGGKGGKGGRDYGAGKGNFSSRGSARGR
jgi:RNA recognition motif-containing protein